MTIHLTDTEYEAIKRVARTYSAEVLSHQPDDFLTGPHLGLRFTSDNPTLFVSFLLDLSDKHRNLAEHFRTCWSEVPKPRAVDYLFPHVLLEEADEFYDDDEWLLEANDDDDN